MDAFGSGEPENPLDFAKPELAAALAETQPGQGGKSGLRVRGRFFVTEAKVLTLGLEVTNLTGNAVAQEFDLKFNKNAFAVFVANAANALTIPAPGASTYAEIPCTIDKRNLDAKTPPKNPFMIQIAMKTALDVFFFQVPCLLHCLLNTSKTLTEQEYTTFWQKIKDVNKLTLSVPRASLYTGYQEGDPIELLAEGLPKNFFACVRRASGSASFGAQTINNLPILFDVQLDALTDTLTVTYKVPVPPIKDLVTDCIRFVLTRQQ